MTRDDRIEEVWIERNEGLIPSRLFAGSQDELIDIVRDLLARFHVGPMQTEVYVEAMESAVMDFESGALKKRLSREDCMGVSREEAVW